MMSKKRKLSAIVLAVILSISLMQPLTMYAKDGVPSAELIGVDTETKGDWIGVYGTEGYLLYDGYAGDYVTLLRHQRLPLYADFTESNTGVVNGPYKENISNDSALLMPVDGENRISTMYCTDGSLVYDIEVGNLTKRISFYVSNFEATWYDRPFELAASDAEGNPLMTPVRHEGAPDGRYITIEISGHVILTLTHVGSANFGLSAVFFDPLPGETPVPPPVPESGEAAAHFEGVDETTKGLWNGQYGSDGYYWFYHAAANNIAVSPAGTSVLLGGEYYYTNTAGLWGYWSTYPYDAALEESVLNYPNVSGVQRLEGGIRTASLMSVDIDTGGETKFVSFYISNYENNGTVDRSFEITVLDADGNLLIEKTAYAGSAHGRYFTFEISGAVSFKFEKTGADDFELAAIFFDSPPEEPVKVRPEGGIDTTKLEKMVFINYMIAMGYFWEHSVEAQQWINGANPYLNEIAYARETGADGFLVYYPYMPNQVDLFPNLDFLYYEASQYDDFKLILQIPAVEYPMPGGTVTEADIREHMKDNVKRYYNHPTQYMVEGKAVVSAWGGENRGAKFWKAFVDELYTEGYPIVFGMTESICPP